MKKMLLSLAAVTVAVATLGAQGHGDQGVVTAPAKYVADLWLAHKDARGVEAPSQHVTVPLAEGAAGDFIFQPIRFELPQLDADQGDMQAYLQVLGTVRAQAAPDGRIGLAVSPSRSQGLRRSSEAASRQIMPSPAGRGAKEFVVADNEAVAMELPAPTSGFYMKSLKDEPQAGGRFGGAGGVMVAPSPAPAGAVARRGGTGGASAGPTSGGGGTMSRVTPAPAPQTGGVATGSFGPASAGTGGGVMVRSAMPDEPLSVKDGRMILRNDLFFKGHTTTLTIRVRRQ